MARPAVRQPRSFTSRRTSAGATGRAFRKAADLSAVSTKLSDHSPTVLGGSSALVFGEEPRDGGGDADRGARHPRLFDADFLNADCRKRSHHHEGVLRAGMERPETRNDDDPDARLQKLSNEPLSRARAATTSAQDAATPKPQ